MELFTFLSCIDAEEEITLASRKLISNYRQPPYRAQIKNAWLIKGEFKISMSQSGATPDEALSNLANYIAGEKILYRDDELRVPKTLTHTLKYFPDEYYSESRKPETQSSFSCYKQRYKKYN